MNSKVLKMPFSKIYDLYLAKVIQKGRTKAEVDIVIIWLTGHNDSSLVAAINHQLTVEEFFSTFPALNVNANLITGSICGCKLEEIIDPIEKNIRLLDKLIDELAKGKSIDKILRKK